MKVIIFSISLVSLPFFNLSGMNAINRRTIVENIVKPTTKEKKLYKKKLRIPVTTFLKTLPPELLNDVYQYLDKSYENEVLSIGALTAVNVIALDKNLKEGFDAKIVLANGWPITWLAFMNGSFAALPMLQMLAANGMNINAKNKNNMSLLTHVCKNFTSEEIRTKQGLIRYIFDSLTPEQQKIERKILKRIAQKKFESRPFNAPKVSVCPQPSRPPNQLFSCIFACIKCCKEESLIID